MVKTNMRGFTCGAFDLLHPGHLFLLKSAKRKCSWLIVGLHIDPSVERPEKNPPIQSAFERYVQLASCKYVDEIVPYETEEDLRNLLEIYDIDVRFVGSEYEETQDKISGRNLVPITYIPRKHTYSTTELRSRFHDRHTNTTKN